LLDEKTGDLHRSTGLIEQRGARLESASSAIPFSRSARAVEPSGAPVERSTGKTGFSLRRPLPSMGLDAAPSGAGEAQTLNAPDACGCTEPRSPNAGGSADRKAPDP